MPCQLFGYKNVVLYLVNYLDIVWWTESIRRLDTPITAHTNIFLKTKY